MNIINLSQPPNKKRKTHNNSILEYVEDKNIDVKLKQEMKNWLQKKINEIKEK